MVSLPTLRTTISKHCKAKKSSKKRKRNTIVMASVNLTKEPNNIKYLSVNTTNIKSDNYRLKKKYSSPLFAPSPVKAKKLHSYKET